jgi:hypothetical protein
MQALIGGVSFEPGQQYLVTATDGVVKYCALSGPATPELQALFDQSLLAGLTTRFEARISLDA